MNLRKLVVNKLLYNKYLYKTIQIYFNIIIPIISDIKTKIYYYIFCKWTNNNEFLPILTFEPTNICNAKCNFCAYRKIDDKKSIMSFDLFKKWLDQFLEKWWKQIWLTPTVWEAFIDKWLFDKINYAKHNWIIVKLFSNWTLLNINENYKKIVDSKIDELSISIWDINYEKEAEIYGINIELAKEKIEWIKNLIKYNNENLWIKKISLNFRSTRSPYKIINDSDFKSLCIEKLNFEFVYDFLLWYDNWWWMIENKDLTGIMKLKRPIKFRKYPCIRLYNAISILSNWDIRLCGCRITNTVFDDLIIWNLNNNNLDELLNSKKVRAIRESFEKDKLPHVCSNCSFYEPYLNN